MKKLNPFCDKFALTYQELSKKEIYRIQKKIVLVLIDFVANE